MTDEQYYAMLYAEFDFDTMVCFILCSSPVMFQH